MYKKCAVTLPDTYSGKFDKYISYMDILNNYIEEEIEDTIRYMLEK